MCPKFCNAVIYDYCTIESDTIVETQLFTLLVNIKFTSLRESGIYRLKLPQVLISKSIKFIHEANFVGCHSFRLTVLQSHM